MGWLSKPPHFFSDYFQYLIAIDRNIQFRSYTLLTIYISRQDGRMRKGNEEDVRSDRRRSFQARQSSAFWIECLIENAQPENDYMETECMDAAQFYELDRNTVSIIRHAISSSFYIAFMICGFLKNISL